jgi:hypothetical protein
MQRWRDLMAFAFAPGIAAICVGLFMRPDAPFGIAVWAAAVTYGHAFALGIPVYMGLRHRKALRALNIVAASFAIGAIPVWLWITALGGGMNYASVGGQVTIEDGRITPAGHLMNLQAAAVCGLIGAGTALVWRAISGGRSDDS